MELRPLGKTGMSVSAIGLGTVKLGRNRGLKYPMPAGGRGGAGGAAAFELPSDQQVVELLATASECGVNLIDTAPAYGTSEERIGRAMADQGWFGGRERWVVSTKVGEEFDEASETSRFDFSGAAVRASVKRSLRRLGTDWLDIVMLHSSGVDEVNLVCGEGMDELRRLKQAGLVRAIGASTKTVDGGLAAVRASMGGSDVVMVTFNPRERREEIVIEGARLRGVGVLVKKALMSGHTVDDLGALLPASLKAIQDPGEASLRFALGRAGVSSVVVGTASADRLRGNAKVAG